MPVSADIAQELVDSILDFLYDDHASLLSCSMVAQKWVSATRHHVFQRITINHFFPGRGHFFKDSAHSFLALCRSPHCTIIPSVWEVVLNVDSDPVPAMLKELVDILGRAPVSKMLFIDHTTSFRDPISLSWITPHFPGLREFSYNSLDRFVLDIFGFVASFPQLHTLSLYSNTKDAAKTSITQAKPYPTLPGAPLASLHTLRLRLFSHQSAEFMAWLQTFGDRIQLETLEVDVFHFYHNGWGPIASMNAFLDANGAHVRTFALRLHLEDDREVDETILLSTPSDGDLDLSGLTHVRSLSLSTHNGEAMCAALASLPSDPQTLDTLRVSFLPWIHYDDFPCMCDPRIILAEFVDVMSRDQFAQLAEFTILVPAFFGDGGREALRQYFPKWKGTDILRIGFVSRFEFPLDSWEGVRDALLDTLAG
ncbi:hypothetical protein K438DRAFT_1985840 [Mycena galopus ATCC 62051]|nr:hypothetical protein K438DRAFT_1985840 [Mycena galopus ATCC 62051]